jgi:DNA invertase Pin-like site-specific DNA recombinase
MPRAVIYCRVSTKEQVQTLSLPTQRRACGDYCERQGWEVDRIFVEEGASAKTADRTELNNLILHCCRNKGRIDYVVVYTLSRFARDTKVHHALAGALASSGIALRSATEPIDGSPAGRFMESIFSSIAQFDNDVKAERTREGMCAALRLGRWTFQAPVGYLNGVRGGPSLVPDPARAELVRLAFEDYASGRFQKSDLLKRLDARGLKTRRGQALSPQTLHAILCNRLYAGRIDVPKWGISVRGDFEPLVPEEVFLRVQARLPGRGKPPALHRRDHPDFPLRRFVACAACGKPLTGSNSRGKSARPYPYYHCVACGKVRVRKSRLEDEFRGLLARLRPREEYARLFNEIVLDVWRDRQKETRQSRARLEV